MPTFKPLFQRIIGEDSRRGACDVSKLPRRNKKRLLQQRTSEASIGENNGNFYKKKSWPFFK